MLEAALWGLLAGSVLVVGGVAAILLTIPRRVVALIAAFGAGALVSALAFDLTEEAFRLGGTPVVAPGLAAGGLAFFVGNRLVAVIGGRSHRPRIKALREAPEPSGPGIVLGVLLDGIPESVVLGSTLIGGGGVGIPFLAAVMIANLPEAVLGTADLRQEGLQARWIIGVWVAAAIAAAVAAALGFAVLGKMSEVPVAATQAFAAGAILAMLAETMFPEAFEHGGDVVGLATVLGFAAAFLLSTAA